MKKIVVLCILWFGFYAKAQVGIGTTSPNAQLDISASNQATPANNDGILIPKIDTFPATNPTALQQGMLVYLTTTTTFASVSRAPGFYYWDNPTTNWISIQTNPTSSWNLLGNASTSPVTNFLGTTDNQDIVFKRNNIRAGYIGDPIISAGKYLNSNTVFGANSLLNPSINVASQFGIRNTAFGSNIMPTVTTGNNNTAIGDRALFTDSSGSNNTAVGTGALYTNGIGGFNTAVGRNALVSNSSGNNNTSLGYNSGFLSTGSSNVFLGYNAGYNETGSNKLYIDNSNADANNALIYGDFGSTPKILRANGQVQIGNPAVTGYALPTVRGNAGQLLQTDGAGGTSWVDTQNNISIVRTNLSANQSLGTSGWQKLSFNTVVFDTKSEFSTTNNRFVAAKAGYYEVNAGFHTFNQNDTNYYGIAVFKNGSEYQETSAHHYGINLISRTINCVIYLNASDYIEIYAHNVNSGTTIDAFSGKTYFEVKQIR